MLIEQLPENAYVVLVTGDRLWTDLASVAHRLQTLPPETVIVHGYAKGLDTIVDVVARELGFRVIRCPSHWRHNDPKCVEVWGACPEDCAEVVGRPAGMIRNHKMLDSYHPRLVLAFYDNIIDSKGTKGMLKYAQKKKVENWLYTSSGEIIQSPPLTTPRRSRTFKKKPLVDTFFEWE
jgi:hypothetical protein